jgi:hypothetical protein
MIEFIGVSITISTNYNSSQSVTNTRSIPYWTTSVFCRDWLGSDLRVSHFFSFRCPLVNAPQLNSRLSDKCRTTAHGWLSSDWTMTHWTNSFITSGRTIYKSPCLTAPLLSCFSVFIPYHGNVLTEPLPSNGLFRSYSLEREHAYRTVA